MAFTYKNKRVGYDNIAPGSAAGWEHVVVAGNVSPPSTAVNLESGGNTSTSVLALGRRENLIKAPTTDDNHVQETALTSGTTHTGYTSGTSVTSSFPETVG